MSPSCDLPEAVDPRRLAEILQQIADAAIVQLVAEAQPRRSSRAHSAPRPHVDLAQFPADLTSRDIARALGADRSDIRHLSEQVDKERSGANDRRISAGRERCSAGRSNCLLLRCTRAAARGRAMCSHHDSEPPEQQAFVRDLRLTEAELWHRVDGRVLQLLYRSEDVLTTVARADDVDALRTAVETLAAEVASLLQKVELREQNAPGQEWFTVKEAAAYVRRPASAVSRAAREGALRGTKASVGARWSFGRTDLDDWLERGRVAQTPRSRRAASELALSRRRRVGP
jgi:excisionase family DNA binding protein